MRRYVMFVCVLVLVTGCSSTPLAPRYSIVQDDTYNGVVFPSVGYPEVGEWRTFGRSPVANEYGLLMVFTRRSTEREDLIVMFTPGPETVGVHALRLTGDTSNLHLDLVCPGDSAVLVPGGSLGGPYPAIEDGIRAWRPGPDGALEEFNPADADPTGAC
jgi:hypothetical protein